MKEKVLVAGSINMDIVVGTDRLPSPGETVTGRDLKYIPGGKGANQAIAASRLGADVSFIGKVGNDSFGQDLLQVLKKEKLDITGVSEAKSSSGVALINVDDRGENSIVVVPGSNAQVSSSYIKRHEQLIKAADIIVAQYEIPMESVNTLLTLAKKHDKTTVLNPAPAKKTPDSILKNVDYLVLNETELSFFDEKETVLLDMNEITHAAKKLLKKGPKHVIVTLGSQGSLAVDKDSARKTQGIQVEAVDTTGAGDCFVGALAARLSKDTPLQESLIFANKAAALSVQKWGASSSMPYLSEVLS